MPRKKEMIFQDTESCSAPPDSPKSEKIVLPAIEKIDPTKVDYDFRTCSQMNAKKVELR